MDEHLELIFPRLTYRRVQLLAVLADSRTLQEAAGLLGVEKSTVETHAAELRSLAAVESTRELARWWRQVRADYVAWVRTLIVGTPEKPST